MKSIHIWILLMGLLFVSLSGCRKSADPELEGQDCLRQARQALVAKDYNRAKSMIDSLRKKYPLALNAREEGILLLDSINLAEAQVDLARKEEQLRQPGLSRIAIDTLKFNLDEAEQKVRFFEKKIEHDKANRKVH